MSLFGSQGFRWGNATALVVALGEFGPLFFLPLYLVNVLGLSTLGAGVVLAHVGVEQSGQGSAVQSTARRLGSALGVALVGGLLPVLLSHTLPQKAESVPGVPASAAGPAVVDALDEGFAPRPPGGPCPPPPGSPGSGRSPRRGSPGARPRGPVRPLPGPRPAAS